MKKISEELYKIIKESNISEADRIKLYRALEGRIHLQEHIVQMQSLLSERTIR